MFPKKGADDDDCRGRELFTSFFQVFFKAMTFYLNVSLKQHLFCITVSRVFAF